MKPLTVLGSPEPLLLEVEHANIASAANAVAEIEKAPILSNRFMIISPRFKTTKGRDDSA
jgi:hypothetical protein